MPQIIKQLPNQVTGQPTRVAPNGKRTGSILSTAIDVSDLQEDYLKIVIYGQNRVGKTWLACQFPKPLLLVAFEPNKTGGAKSVKGFDKLYPGEIKLLRVTSSVTARDIAQELKNDNHFKSVVLDSATSLKDLFSREIIGEATKEQLNFGDMSQDDYIKRSERLKEALRPFLDLDKHTIVLAKETDHNPPKRDAGANSSRLTRNVVDTSYLASDIGAGAAYWLHDACDNIFRLYYDLEVKEEKKRIPKAGGKFEEKIVKVHTGKTLRCLRVLPHTNCAGGIRSELPEDKIPAVIEKPTFEKIYALIRGESKE